jgi:uncharacterized protein (TIGR02757 family)
LDRKVQTYNTKAFIAKDPISVPHQFSKKQDIEIAGFFAAIIAWGNRTTIIQNANRIMHAMENDPYHFICHHKPNDLKAFLTIKHRTFQPTDILYFIHFLQYHYSKHKSLESAFFFSTSSNIKESLIRFHNYFFSLEHPERTRKHISTPQKNAACKRLAMYLRWMVRSDKQGVDFGIWKTCKPEHLICPLDIHVSRVAYRLGLLPNEKATWMHAEILTKNLRQLDASDPCKYDFALFGLGAEERVK